jgi:hypothetical protein
LQGISKRGFHMSDKRTKRYPHEKVFIVNERYAGIKDLSDIFADLLYAAYCKRERGNTGKKINHDGCLPNRTGHDNYAGV